MSIFNETQINFLTNFWENERVRHLVDRRYKFSILKNENLSIIQSLLKWFMDKSGENLKKKEYNLIIHKFENGDFFAKHKDNIDNKGRAYVVGFHITENYDGGDYILYNPYQIISKKVGEPYFFKSDRLHEIQTIKNGIRKSALIFINYSDLLDKKIL